jgi:hypothetical protein
MSFSEDKLDLLMTKKTFGSKPKEYSIGSYPFWNC